MILAVLSACTACAITAILLWRTHRRAAIALAMTGGLVVGLGIATMALVAGEVDRCLDRGGRWNDRTKTCEGCEGCPPVDSLATP